MKIISSFKDYYDSVSHQYLDKEILYKRETTGITLSPKETQRGVFPELGAFEIKDFGRITLEIIGFCGNFYPVILFTPSSELTSADTVYNSAAEGFYSIEDFKAFLEASGINIAEMGKRYGKYRLHFSLSLTVEDLTRFLNSREHYGVLNKYFLSEQTPVFVVKKPTMSSKATLKLSPFLKAYSFAKVKDPFSAHQELFQFVSGRLQQAEKPMIQISDADKIHKHGFNKWSFRKLPTK